MAHNGHSDISPRPLSILNTVVIKSWQYGITWSNIEATMAKARPLWIHYDCDLPTQRLEKLCQDATWSTHNNLLTAGITTLVVRPWQTRHYIHPRFFSLRGRFFCWIGQSGQSYGDLSSWRWLSSLLQQIPDEFSKGDSTYINKEGRVKRFNAILSILGSSQPEP